MSQNSGLKLQIVKKHLIEETGKFQEALKIEFSHEIRVDKEVMNSTVSLFYTSDTLKSVKGYLYTKERDKMFAVAEIFAEKFLEALVTEKANMIETV